MQPVEIEVGSAYAETGELASIVDSYIDELVSIAAARGVISFELVRYLKAPDSMGESEDEEESYESSDEEDENSVSMVRKALRGSWNSGITALDI